MDSEQKDKLKLSLVILLSLAAAGGILTLAIAFPGALQAFAPLLKRYKPNTLKPNYLKRNLRLLEEQGLVTISEHDDKIKIQITQKGKTKVLEYEAEKLIIKKQEPWDKKWRVVIFDIPEKKKSAREIFRKKLTDLGFKKIQHSVWRQKYPCFSEIEFLANLYQIRPYVNLIEGEVTRF